MKKLFLISTGLLVACFAQAQPVSDNATIPIGVTLNSILRLTVVSGGNIEFVVNSMTDYTNGINLGGGNSRYQTRFNVASSVNYQVNMYSETPTMGSSDLADTTSGGSIQIDNIGYRLGNAAGADIIANPANYTIISIGGVIGLSDVPTTQLVAGPAGDALANEFVIKWQLGTAQGTMDSRSLLEQSLPAGRYSTNVVLVLASQ